MSKDYAHLLHLFRFSVVYPTAQRWAFHCVFSLLTPVRIELQVLYMLFVTNPIRLVRSFGHVFLVSFPHLYRWIGCRIVAKECPLWNRLHLFFIPSELILDKRQKKTNDHTLAIIFSLTISGLFTVVISAWNKFASTSLSLIFAGWYGLLGFVIFWVSFAEDLLAKSRIAAISHWSPQSSNFSFGSLKNSSPASVSSGSKNEANIYEQGHKNTLVWPEAGCTQLRTSNGGCTVGISKITSFGNKNLSPGFALNSMTKSRKTSSCVGLAPFGTVYGTKGANMSPGCWAFACAITAGGAVFCWFSGDVFDNTSLFPDSCIPAACAMSVHDSMRIAS